MAITAGFYPASSEFESLRLHHIKPFTSFKEAEICEL